MHSAVKKSCMFTFDYIHGTGGALVCNKDRLQDSKRNFGHSSVSVIELERMKKSIEAPRKRRSRVFRNICSFPVADHVLALDLAPVVEFRSVVNVLNVHM
jgi:hypothetical protein